MMVPRSPATRPRSAPRRIALALILAQITAACASTARQPAGAPTQPLTASETGSPAATLTPGPGIGGDDPSGPPGSVAAAPGGTTGAESTAAPGKKAGPALVQPSGPGVTKSTITIGFPMPRDAAEAAEEWGQVAGVEPAPQVDWMPVIRTIIEDINLRGGILGRKVVPHIWWFDTQDYVLLADYIEAECAYFTQDVEVFSVFVGGGDLETLECYRKARMPVIGSWGNILDEEAQAEYPNAFQISTPNVTRQTRLMASGLERAGFLREGARVGIASFDFPPMKRAIDKVLKPALQARGHSISESYVTPPRTPEALGVMLAQVRNTVVRFRAEGVRQVLIVDHNAYLGWAFMSAAEEQKHRDFEYGLTSATGGDLVDWQGTRWFPAEQMNAAVILSWGPLGDIRQEEGLGMVPPTAKRCVNLLARNDLRFDSRTCCALWIALEWCNRLWFLEAALERQPTDAVNLKTFIRGAESLGSSFKAADAFPVTFGPGKHDGPAIYRVARWNPVCQCFRYDEGPFRPLP